MAYKFSRDEILFFKKVIPQMIDKRKYYDYSNVLEFLEMEYQNAFDLSENHPDDFHEMSASIVDAWLKQNPPYLVIQMLIGNSVKNLKHLFSDRDNLNVLIQTFKMSMVNNKEKFDDKFFLALFTKPVAFQNNYNFYLNFIRDDKSMQYVFNEIVLDLEF